MGQITLENFLKNVTDLLGVIPADQYLDTMGWTLVTDTEGEVHFVKTGASKNHSLPPTSNLSVRDVVEHCYQIGLLPRPIRRTCGTQLGEGMAISFAAAPNSPHNGPGKAPTAQRKGQDVNERIFGHPAMTITGTRTVGPVAMPVSMENDYQPSIQAVTNDQQRALEAYPSRYPYNLHFHPDIQQPALGFNPAMIQDDFDPFNISDYINFDL